MGKSTSQVSFTWPLKCGLIRALQIKWFLDYFIVNKLLIDFPFIYQSVSLTELRIDCIFEGKL